MRGCSEAGVKLMRLRGELTQKEVAKALGISASAVYMYETGQRVPNDEVKIRLAQFYGTTVGWLFFDEELPNRPK